MIGSNFFKTKAYDGEDQIIFSDVFNLYNNKLLITDIAGFDFEFQFKINKDQAGSSILFGGDTLSKKITIELSNFNNSLGVGTTKPISVLKLDNNREILFSVHCKSLSDTVSFLQVGITFYLKQNEQKA